MESRRGHHILERLRLFMVVAAEFSYPFLASPLIMGAILLAALILFHVFLVWIGPLALSQRAWKKVDYIWLGVAAIGVIGTAGSIRREIAKNFTSEAEAHAQTTYRFARYQIQQLSEGAVCRLFVRSQFSPPNLEQVQAEYDRVCAFGKDAIAKIPTQMPGEIAFPDFGPWPDVKNEMLKQMFSEDQRRIDEYKDERQKLEEIRRDAQYSSLDSSVLFLSPLLIAIALALRITKVTGELRN